MSNVEYQEALDEAQSLTDMSDDELFRELGQRIQDMQNLGGWERAKSFSGEFPQDAEDMLGVEDLKRIGRRWWEKLEPKLMALVCETDNKDMKRVTSGKNLPEVAASLATAAVVLALAPPAWIIVATSILATKITESGLDALCETWEESQR